MSIVKFVNGPNDNRQYLEDMCNYVTDDDKTDGKKWVGSFSCSSEHPLEDMYTAKKLCHKTHGKQGEHFVLSLTPDVPHIEDSVYMEMADEIALLYPDHQCVYALHKDSKVRHLHFILNSVSFKDGKKFSQSPSDLNKFKMRCNDPLDKYGFDIIRISGMELRDTSDHADEVGFDFLEVEELPKTLDTPKACIDILADDEEEFNSDFTRRNNKVSNPFKARLIRVPNTESEDFIMRNDIINQGYMPIPPYAQQKAVSPTSMSTPCYNGAEPPSPFIPQSFPTLTINTGPAILIKGSPDSDLNGIAALAKELDSQTASRQGDAAKLGIAITGKLHEQGLERNVCINISPTIEVDLINQKHDDFIEATISAPSDCSE